jgi:peroxiredoxin
MGALSSGRTGLQAGNFFHEIRVLSIVEGVFLLNIKGDHMKGLLLAVAALGLVLAAAFHQAAAKAKIDEAAPGFSLPGVDGKTYELTGFKGKYVVLEWVNYDCPFVRKHYRSGNMQSLQKEYTQKGVVWLSICSSAPGEQGHFDNDEIKSRMAEQKAVPTAYLIDSEGSVGKTYEAKTTPHMYIINPEGVLIYAGGIDDIPSSKIDDIKSATNYVQTVLDASLAGKQITVKSSRPYGCSVKYGS